MEINGDDNNEYEMMCACIKIMDRSNNESITHKEVSSFLFAQMVMLTTKESVKQRSVRSGLVIMNSGSTINLFGVNLPNF